MDEHRSAQALQAQRFPGKGRCTRRIRSRRLLLLPVARRPTDAHWHFSSPLSFDGSAMNSPSFIFLEATVGGPASITIGPIVAITRRKRSAGTPIGSALVQREAYVSLTPISVREAAVRQLEVVTEKHLKGTSRAGLVAMMCAAGRRSCRRPLDHDHAPQASQSYNGTLQQDHVVHAARDRRGSSDGLGHRVAALGALWWVRSLSDEGDDDEEVPPSSMSKVKITLMPFLLPQ